MQCSEGRGKLQKKRRREQDKSISHGGNGLDDLQDNLSIEKAKLVKGKPMTLEEYEAIRAYDAAKSSPDEVIPFDQAMREISQDRRWAL